MHGRGGIKDSLAFGMLLTIAAENGRRIRGGLLETSFRLTWVYLDVLVALGVGFSLPA